VEEEMKRYGEEILDLAQFNSAH